MSVLWPLAFSSLRLSWPRVQLIRLSRTVADAEALETARIAPVASPSSAGAIEYVKVLLSITVMVCTPLNVVGVAPEIVIDSPVVKPWLNATARAVEVFKLAVTDRLVFGPPGDEDGA